jgi:hypothetical protein
MRPSYAHKSANSETDQAKKRKQREDEQRTREKQDSTARASSARDMGHRVTTAAKPSDQDMSTEIKQRFVSFFTWNT